MESHNQWEAKPSLNREVIRQTNREVINHRKSGNNYLHLTTPDPLPLKSLGRSRCHYLKLGSKSCLPAHTGTWNSMFPPATQPATLHPKWQKNLHPCICRTQGSPCSTDNGRHKPAGLVPLCRQQLLYCASRSLCWQTAPRAPAACKPVTPMTAVLLNWVPRSLCWKAGPRAPTAHRLCSPVTAPAAVAHGSPWPNTSRPQGLCCLVGTRGFKPAGFAAPWASSTCHTVPGGHCHICKWIPSSTLCYSAGARRLPCL
jgi:hypothetical protein